MHLKKPTMTRVSAKDIAYSEIKERVIKCSFKPGEQIVEDELAKELEISRTPLREALQRLEIEELVERQPNGRLKVASISVQEVKELFLVRSLLEGIIIVEAIDNITENDIKHLAYHAFMIKNNSTKSNYEDVDHFGGQFHTTLYTLSNNQTVIKILFQLNDKISRYRRIAHQVDVKKTSDEHEEILNFIIQKDKVNAELAIKKHILDSMEQAVLGVEQYLDSLK